MFKKIVMLPATFALALPLMAMSAVIAVTASSVSLEPAMAADLAAAKATVDAAKAQGLVGEQGDGYLGLVTGAADPGVTAAVDQINAGRAAVFAQTAAKTGVSPQAAGEAAAKQLIAKVAPGQFYKPLGGSWTKK